MGNQMSFHVALLTESFPTLRAWVQFNGVGMELFDMCYQSRLHMEQRAEKEKTTIEIIKSKLQYIAGY